MFSAPVSSNVPDLHSLLRMYGHSLSSLFPKRSSLISMSATFILLQLPGWYRSQIYREKQSGEAITLCRHGWWHSIMTASYYLLQVSSSCYSCYPRNGQSLGSIRCGAVEETPFLPINSYKELAFVHSVRFRIWFSTQNLHFPISPASLSTKKASNRENGSPSQLSIVHYLMVKYSSARNTVDAYQARRRNEGDIQARATTWLTDAFPS